MLTLQGQMVFIFSTKANYALRVGICSIIFHIAALEFNGYSRCSSFLNIGMWSNNLWSVNNFSVQMEIFTKYLDC